MMAVIGCIVSTLAGLADPSGPIAAGTLQAVPAFTDSPHPSVIRTMHPRSQQSHCRHLRLVQELRRISLGKISRPGDSVGGGPWDKAGWGVLLAHGFAVWSQHAPLQILLPIL